MKSVMLLIVVAGAAWWFMSGRGDGNNPEVITNPVYLEHRIDYQVPGYAIKMVLFVKTPGDEDCQRRALKVWQKHLEGCVDCVFKSHECKTDIPSRYLKAMDDGALETTYLRAHRGNRFERSGLIVLWGLNQQQSDRICEQLKSNVNTTYTGTLECVRPVGI